MIIHRILNNNAVIILDKNQNEQIVCGKGIAFKKRPGDFVSEDAVNKVYTLESPEMNSKFEQLVSEIPIEQIQVADAIVELAKSNLGKRLNETLLVSLSDHIHTSILRFKEGISLKNAMLWDIKRFYKEEFAVGVMALDIIEEKLGIRLPEDEAGFLAVHFVNAAMDENIHNMLEITKMMQEISSMVKYMFNLEFDEEDLHYYRFITHVKFFAQRVIAGRTYNDDEDDLLDVIQLKYQAAYSCVVKIDEFIKQKYDYDLSSAEKAYLAIHIHRVVYKTKTD